MAKLLKRKNSWFDVAHIWIICNTDCVFVCFIVAMYHPKLFTSIGTTSQELSQCIVKFNNPGGYGFIHQMNSPQNKRQDSKAKQERLIG